MKFTENLELNDFKASSCWISATLKRNEMFLMNSHGEANDMTYEDREIIMSAWSNNFYGNVAEVDKPPECVHNTNQIGIYHQKLPNCVYIDEAKNRIMLV